MSETVIETQGLVKYYGGRCILNEINLKIPKGCIYGLLGRNGVGKTTLIRILMGMETPTRGATQLLGFDSMRLKSQVKGRIAYVAEGHHLIQGYRVNRLIRLCRSLARQWNQSFFDRLIEAFNLPMDRKIKELSTGMRAQLNLALAMATDPEVLILDDPTLGLDTAARRQFLELAIDLIQRQGRTILFSSHILADVERIADRIGIIVAGDLVVDCSLAHLRERIRKFRVVFAEQAPEQIPLTELVNFKRSGREILLTAANWSEQKQAMLEAQHPLEVIEIPMSLEDVFLECSGAAPVTLTQKEPIEEDHHADLDTTRN